MESKIILIRHGITEGNKKKWFYGGVDIPLIPEGMERLQELADAGVYPEVPEDAQFYTSELVRTHQTMEIVYGHRQARQLPLLNEMRFGEYECTSYEEMKGDPDFEKWAWDETGTIVPPGGESRLQFLERVQAGLKELTGLHRLKEWSHRHGGQSAFSVVVCHGGVIGGIMMTLFPDPEKTIWDWVPDPGFGYELTFSGRMDGEVLGWKAVTMPENVETATI